MNTFPFARVRARRAFSMPLIIAVVMGGLSFGLFTSSAGVSVTQRRAAEAKRITPAGTLVPDLTTRQPAVGALPVNFVRSPDMTGPGGRGRYLVAVNSGSGVQFSAATNRAQQSLSVIDLNARPAPSVVQNVYFPTPQSANVGAAFAPRADADGAYVLYVSGGFENKIWAFRFRPQDGAPVSPASPGPNTEVKAPFIDVSGFGFTPPSLRYNANRAPVYPTGLAVSGDGQTLYVANNLGDSLGIVHNLNGTRDMTRVDLRRDNAEQFMYPYAVVVTTGVEVAKLLPHTAVPTTGQTRAKVYVSCWGDGTVAVISAHEPRQSVRFIPVARHPTTMVLNAARNRLYVANSNADSVSVINTEKDSEVERISVRLNENALTGTSPEGIALSDDERTLYVANAHSNSVAVIALSQEATGGVSYAGRNEAGRAGPERAGAQRSLVRGFIPTGQYPSAVAVAGGRVFVGNGKGTGFENSSVVADSTGLAPNVPNDRFPAGTGRGGGQGGQYSVSLVSGNISQLSEPGERELAVYTQAVMRHNRLLGEPRAKLFRGRSPIKHVIYVIRENRTYDQVFGDVERAGNGQAADGDARLAIFGAGEAAQLRGGGNQNVVQHITPNAHALAARFGLFDRFFVNAEASPDGHNWSTAAFSTDYTDKAYRWNYGGRGRTYDFEGFNRLPNYGVVKDAGPLFPKPIEAGELADYMRRFVPYLHGGRDVAEPDTLYLWDAAARAGLSYRNYGEFVGTISEADVAAVNANRAKSYPDTTPTASAFPTKKSLEGHHSLTYRNFDTNTPDALTVESYRAAKESAGGRVDPLISRANADDRLRGTSRLGEWLAEFQTCASDMQAGRPDRLPNLSILRLPNDHTVGLRAGQPTPQFFVAENDYAVGRLIEAISTSPYWRDTAIFFVEDDAQDGPDHVDCHRSVALVVSAYNRPGALVHEYHSTVSMIRTMELLLGLAPMNQLDASAVPMDIFEDKADLRPFKALLPEVALDNLVAPPAADKATAYWMRRTAGQDLTHADMADPLALNQIIWFSVRGVYGEAMPEVSRLPVFDALREGIAREDEAVTTRRRVKKSSAGDDE